VQVKPSRDEFVALAADHAVVPVWTEALADLTTPLAVYARVAGDGPTFLLESAEHGQRWGRYSFVGMDPFLTLIGRDGGVSWVGSPPPGVAGATGPLDALARATSALRAPKGLIDLPLHGGAVGIISYDAVREMERIPATGHDDLGLPDVVMYFPRHIAGMDHLRQVMTLVTNVVVGEDPDAQYDAAVTDLQHLLDRIAAPLGSDPVAPPDPSSIGSVAGEVQSNMQPADYEAMVEVVKEHIRAGDTFQTVPSQRFAMPTQASALDLYRVLRVINPSPYLFLFDLGDSHVIGSSPEALVRVQGRHVETWPIAGTRPRGATPEQDDAYEAELLASDKERAEHVMLVDLARNDVGRIAETGTVRVRDMMVVERYSHVMHIVSTVEGVLRDGLGPVDVLKAVFPAGTVSGAPKVRAMQIIDELEPTRRGVYAGAAGYVDFSGNLDTCITLRTMVLKDGVAYVQAGAGIVADSVPSEEEAETRNKARALLSAVRAAEGLRGS